MSLPRRPGFTEDSPLSVSGGLRNQLFWPSSRCSHGRRTPRGTPALGNRLDGDQSRICRPSRTGVTRRGCRDDIRGQAVLRGLTAGSLAGHRCPRPPGPLTPSPPWWRTTPPSASLRAEWTCVAHPQAVFPESDDEDHHRQRPDYFRPMSYKTITDHAVNYCYSSGWYILVPDIHCIMHSECRMRHPLPHPKRSGTFSHPRQESDTAGQQHRPGLWVDRLATVRVRITARASAVHALLRTRTGLVSMSRSAARCGPLTDSPRSAHRSSRTSRARRESTRPGRQGRQPARTPVPEPAFAADQRRGCARSRRTPR